jgi:predicted DNA-binding antitoxin AbrB/MazE fold protein
MTLLINGVYRDGVFHPDEPVDLKDNTRVKLVVEAKEAAPPQTAKAGDEVVESDEDRERREVHEILVAAGVVRPGPVPGPSPSLALSEREKEIARKLAKLGPIYDIIREERDSN